MPVTAAAATAPSSIPLPGAVQHFGQEPTFANSIATRKSPKGSPDLDYPPDCFQKLEQADKNDDGRIDSKEFLEFSHLLGLPDDIDESPLSLSMRFNYLACLCHEYGDDDDDCCSDDNAHIDLKEARKDEVLLYFICRLTETAVEDYYPSSSPSRGFFLAPFTIPSFTVFDTPEPTNEPTNEPSPQQQQQPHEPSSFEYITPNPVPPADDTSAPSNAPTIRWMPWGPIPLPTTEPSEAPSFPPSIALSTSPSIVTSTQPSPTPSIAKSRSPSIAASNVPSISPTTSIPSIATSSTPSIPPSILPSVTSSTTSITFGPSAIPTTTTTTSASPEPSTPSPSPSTSEVESRMRIALRKTQEWSVAYRLEIVQALTLLQVSLQQRLQQQSWRRWLQRRRQQQESTDTNRQTAQIVNETTVSCPSSITLTHECRDVTIRVSVPNGTSIEDASIAINNAIDDGYLQRLIAEINPDSTTTVLGVVPSETEPSTNAPTLSPSPSKQPPGKGDGTITPTTTSTTNNDTANSDPFISGASDPGGMSSVAIGALVVLGTAVFLIGCAIVVRMVRHSYRQKQDREAAPPTIIHARRGASFSEDENDDDEMMNLNHGDVELGRDVSEDSRARRRRHEQLQQRAIKYRSVSSGSDSFIDPLDPYLYSTSAHEMYPWHNNGKTTDTETTSESTPLFVDSSIHASPYEENIYDGRMALGVAVGIIAEDRFEQFEDTGDPLDTSYMERNDDAPKELVLASDTAQFDPDHSDGSDLSTDSADIWTERNFSSPEQLIQASETAQFDPTADHSREILPKGLAAAIAVSNGMASDAISDTSTDSSSDEESSSSAGDSTSSSSSSGSSSTEDLATGITNYDPKTAEVAIASATMIGVVVALTRSEDERYESDDEWETSETNAAAVSLNDTPNARNVCKASESKGIPESTRSPQQDPMVKFLPVVAAANVPAMASFSDSESSYDEGQTSDDKESVADIVVPSNIDAASPVTDVNAINTMFVLRPGDLPQEQGVRESNAIGVGNASVSVTAAEAENFKISSPDRDTSMSGETGSNCGMMFLAAPVVAGTYFTGDASSSGASEGDISNVTTDRNPLPGAVVAARGISGDAVPSQIDNEGSSAPSMASPTAAVVAGASFGDDASSSSDSSSASEGDSLSANADPNPFSGAVMTATGIVGDLRSTDSGSEGSSMPSMTSPAAAAVAGAPFGDDASSSSDSSSASEVDTSNADADPNPFPGAVISATGIVGDLPSTGSDSEGSSMPSMTSPRTSVTDDASSSGDSSSASAGNPSNANADPNPLPRAVVAVTGTIGDSPSTDSDSDDTDSRGSDSEFVPAPYPYHDSFSDFNSRQVAAGSSTPESLRASLSDLNGFRDLSRAPLPVEDSISDFSTRQNLHTSSEIMCAPMPATDSFSDLQTRQPTSALSRASVQLSMTEDPFEKSREGPNTAMAGTKVQDASHQPESSLLLFQQRRSQRLSAFSSSMRANSVARRKSTADPTLTRSYDRNDLRSSMPPPTLSGLFDVRLRSLHEHTDQDDKSDSSYFDSVVGGADDVDTTDKGKTVAFQGALEVAAFESALGRFSMEADAVIADDAVAAGPNKFVGGHSTDKVNTVDRLQPMPLSDQRMAEEDIWVSIADVGAPEHDRSDEVLVWALSRSMSRLAAADRMGELSLPPGIVQVSSSSSDGGEPNDNDLSSLGTPVSSSSSSVSSEVER